MKDLKPFVVDTRLEEYMESSKWEGKIFMQDEKTCFKDGFEDGFNMAYKELELFKKENEQLKQSNWELLKKIEKMKNCGNCNGIRKGIRDERCKYCFKHKDLRYWELAE